MFHDGDLRSGIALSLSQNKLLTCFVTDDSQEASKTWEAVLRQHAGLIESKTVILKFTSASQESVYLNTFCPISQAPAIVVIKYGAVVAKLEGELEQTDIAARLRTALGAVDSTELPGPANRAGGPEAIAEPIAAPTQQEQPEATEHSRSVQSSETIHTLLPDRAARLEADQAAKQAAARAERVARAEARRKEVEASTRKGKGKQIGDGNELGKQKARADWVKQQAKRKEELVKERERILQSIESDRQERQHRARSKQEQTAASEPLPISVKHELSSKAAAGRTCNIQVRLPDGTSVRRRFEASASLADSIRPWIKESISQDNVVSHYKLKFLKSPHHSRTFSADDEKQTFAELAMLPSATLMMIEQGSAQAAVDTSSLNSMMLFLYAIITAISNFFSSMLGVPRGASAEHGSNTSDALGESTGIQSNSSSNMVSQRTKTLADSRARDPDARAEFYNGNNSAFEGRKDDDGT